MHASVIVNHWLSFNFRSERHIKYTQKEFSCPCQLKMVLNFFLMATKSFHGEKVWVQLLRQVTKYER